MSRAGRLCGEPGCRGAGCRGAGVLGAGQRLTRWHSDEAEADGKAKDMESKPTSAAMLVQGRQLPTSPGVPPLLEWGWKGSGCCHKETSLSRSQPHRDQGCFQSVVPAAQISVVAISYEHRRKEQQTEPRFGWERLGPPCTFLLTEVA